MKLLILLSILISSNAYCQDNASPNILLDTVYTINNDTISIKVESYEYQMIECYYLVNGNLKMFSRDFNNLSQSVQFEDYNNDGFIDILILNKDTLTISNIYLYNPEKHLFEFKKPE